MENKELLLKVENWVDKLNTIESSLIERAIGGNFEDWIELTPIAKGATIIYDGNSYTVSKIEEIEDEKFVVIEELEDLIPISEVNLDFETYMPLWGYLWSFNSNSDQTFCETILEEVASCGFRIFKDAITDTIYLGLDGCGYDFYEAHWVPLYKLFFNL